MSAETLVAVAGWLQVAQLPSLILIGRLGRPRAAEPDAEPAAARLVKARAVGETTTVVGLGLVVVSAPGELVGGGRLGTALCLVLSLAWAVRAALHFFYLRKLWFPGPRLARRTYDGVGALFIFLALAFMMGVASAIKNHPACVW